jgi:hypothetical protein
MSALPATLPRRPALPPSLKLAPDRRRHVRFKVVLFGRFMRESKHEYPCKLLDISVGGAALISPVVPELGEPIIAYFDQLGGLQGKVVRTLEGGFAIGFIATQHKREKLAAQITWLINRQELGGPEDRRHERIALKNHVSTLKLPDGQTVECKVLDVSLSGASVGTTARPEVGSEVVVGKMRARVVRRSETGIGVEFVDLQDAEALRRHFS